MKKKSINIERNGMKGNVIQLDIDWSSTLGTLYVLKP